MRTDGSGTHLNVGESHSHHSRIELAQPPRCFYVLKSRHLTTSNSTRHTSSFPCCLSPRTWYTVLFQPSVRQFWIFRCPRRQKIFLSFMVIFAHIKKSWMLRITEHLVEIVQYVPSNPNLCKTLEPLPTRRAIRYGVQLFRSLIKLDP
jgi:hypothetical protein